MKGERDHSSDLHIVVGPNGSVSELFGRRLDLTPSGSVVIEGRRRKKKIELRYTPKK